MTTASPAGDHKPSLPAAKLPGVVAPQPPADALEKLETAARRGRLAGYIKLSAQTFRCDAFGQPFESELLGTITPHEGGSTLSFGVKLRPMLPWIFAVVSVLTVWPGVWLTDSLMLTYFPSFTERVPTAWWYLPITILPLPFAGFSTLRKSRRTGLASAHEMVQKVATELGGRVVR